MLVDLIIIIFYFIIITGIGLYAGRKEPNLEEFALGGRRLPWWAVMASIIAAETSAATFLGAPAEGFRMRGLVYVQLTIGLILGRLVVGFLFLKPYYEHRVYTVYDFLAIRFGPWSKNYVSALFLLMRTLASGVRLYVPALVMVLLARVCLRQEPVAYGQIESFVPYVWAIAALTLLTCIYTALGGIKAVIWTDVIQATLMIGSALFSIGALLHDLGGGNFFHGLQTLRTHVPEMTSVRGYLLTGMEDVDENAGAWQVIKHILANPYTLPAALLAASFSNMAAFGTDQDMVQRMLSAKDHRQGRRSLFVAALLDVPVATAFTFIGVLLIAYYAEHPELRPLKDNDVFGAYILGAMPQVLRGFVLAGLFATAMGSLSAALNALSVSLVNDWYIPYIASGREPAHYVRVARIATGLFALAMIAIATGFAYLNVRDPRLTIIPVALGVASFILGPMLGVFLVGMLTRTRGSDAGNMVAISAGLIAVFLAYGKVQFTWYSVIGSLTTFLVGILFRTQDKSARVGPSIALS